MCNNFALVENSFITFYGLRKTFFIVSSKTFFFVIIAISTTQIIFNQKTKSISKSPTAAKMHYSSFSFILLDLISRKFFKKLFCVKNQNAKKGVKLLPF